MSDILIRPLVPSDVDEVMKIEERCFATPWSREAMDRDAVSTATRYFVAEIDGHVAAYAGAWLVIDQADIVNVAVHPDFRRQGLATRVLEALLDALLAVDIKVVFLEVRQSNLPAQALYKKLGFKRCGLRKGYYEDNHEDAILMLNDRIELSLLRIRRAQNT